MADERSATDPITVLDLFAGCGGLTEGFHQFRPSGRPEAPVFRSMGAVEWDNAAAASYAMNFGGQGGRRVPFALPKIHHGDITDWNPDWKPGEIDVVVGGPPCQGFSGLNRSGAGAERNKLWQEFIRVVVMVQPKVFVIENVDRFVRSPEFFDLHQRIGSGDLSNYRLVDPPDAKDGDSREQRARRYLLNAADYGALQARRRAIVIGVLEDPEGSARMDYPAVTHSREAFDNKDALDFGSRPIELKRPWRTVDDLFSRTGARRLDGTELPPGHRFVVEVGAEFPGPFTTSQLHFGRKPEAISEARYRAIPPAGNRMDLRGRYVCTFESGKSVIVEREGAGLLPPDEDRINGDYVEVRADNGRRRKFAVLTSHASGETEFKGSRRGVGRAYRVVVRHGSRDFAATLEYLSTESWDAHNSGAGDVMGRMRLGAPSVTIRTEFFKPEKGRYLHPTENRPITHYEAAKIQGFPEDFRWCGSKTAIARQIGNAVPIPLGTAIAGAIYEYLRPPTEVPGPTS